MSSADSGALVITTLATNGEEDPPIWQKILWSSIIALVASTLLLAGGINALQTMTIITASPVLVVILTGAFCLIKSLRVDVLLQISVKQHNTVLQYSNASSTWRERLQSLVMHPQKKEVANFIANIVVPALKEYSLALSPANSLTEPSFCLAAKMFNIVLDAAFEYSTKPGKLRYPLAAGITFVASVTPVFE